MKYIPLVIVLVFSSLSVFSQDSLACEAIKTGFFTYNDDDKKMYIYRIDDMQYEWDSENTTFISGKIAWRDSCVYELYLSDFKVIGFPEEYKKMVPEEQLDTFVNLMKSILMNSEIDAHILSIDKDGNYSSSVKVLGERKEMELRRISKKKGEQQYKQMLKAIENNKNNEKKKRKKKVEPLLKF